MWMRPVALLIVCLGLSLAYASDMPQGSELMLQLAQKRSKYDEAMQFNPTIQPTTDGQSFILIWRPMGEMPRDWIVSLHGEKGFATDNLVAWAPHLAGRHIGLILPQWWMGDDDNHYMKPSKIYHEIDHALRGIDVTYHRIMLEGINRGAGNVYAIAAMDVAKNNKYFDLIVPNAGGVMFDYPPTQLILDGEYGAQPFTGTSWVTICGMKDEKPELNGCPAMKRTSDWITTMGGTITDRIEDKENGNDALHKNAQNMRYLLNDFQSAMDIFEDKENPKP